MTRALTWKPGTTPPDTDRPVICTFGEHPVPCILRWNGQWVHHFSGRHIDGDLRRGWIDYPDGEP